MRQLVPVLVIPDFQVVVPVGRVELEAAAHRIPRHWVVVGWRLPSCFEASQQTSARTPAYWYPHPSELRYQLD